jgi:hypothetical protein
MVHLRLFVGQGFVDVCVIFGVIGILIGAGLVFIRNFHYRAEPQQPFNVGIRK